jgi:carbon monoxide dehydrogenase subunit G
MEAIAKRWIAASPKDVAAVMFDPRRDPEWIGGAKSVEPPQGSPLAIGARVTRHGGFMGRRFSWQTEVAEHEPDRLLHMNFVGGPMKGGTVIYLIEPDGNGSLVSIRNTGPGPQMMSWFVKRSVMKDLGRLAKLVE